MVKGRSPGNCDVPFFHALICTGCPHLTECQRLVDKRAKKT